MDDEALLHLLHDRRRADLQLWVVKLKERRQESIQHLGQPLQMSPVNPATVSRESEASRLGDGRSA